MSRRRCGLFAKAETEPPEAALRNVVAALRAACEPVSAAIRNSLNVFHCPQLGHLPIHFGLSCPQLLQTKAILSFAISKTKVIRFFLVTKFILNFATI